jgi:S1-C subfamily serine protease
MGRSTDKKVGEPITAVAYSINAALTSSRGDIAGLFAYGGAGRVVQGSAAFERGNSGGGLFDREGRLIGILTFKLRAGGAYHFALPVEWVEALVAEKSDSAHVAAGTPFWERSGERQPLFVRVASLSARGDCGALDRLAAQSLAHDQGSHDTTFMLERAQQCHAGPKL